MAAITFDTLKYAEKLKSAGISEVQAKAQVEALTEAMQDNFYDLVTKNDLKEAELHLEAKIDKLDAKTDKIETSINGEILLLKWMMGFVLAGITTLIIKSFF